MRLVNSVKTTGRLCGLESVGEHRWPAVASFQISTPRRYDGVRKGEP